MGCLESRIVEFVLDFVKLFSRDRNSKQRFVFFGFSRLRFLFNCSD